MEFQSKDHERSTGAPSFRDNSACGFRTVNLQRAKRCIFAHQVRTILVLCCILFMCRPVRCISYDYAYIETESQEMSREESENYLKTVVQMVTFNNGLKYPILGLGTWQGTHVGLIEKAEINQAIRTAIDVGFRHFDCASYYKNEKYVGDAIIDRINNRFITRKNVYITDKLWNTDHNPEDVQPALQKSLDNLGLGHIDLYLMHWPVASTLDENGHIVASNYSFVDTWRAMEECVKLGLTKSIGVSNFNIKQLKVLLASATIKPVVNQVESHPYLTQNELKKFCESNGIILAAYGPLGSPYSIKKSNNLIMRDSVVLDMAQKYYKSPAQILIRFQIQRGVMVIPKSIDFRRQLNDFEVWDFQIQDEDMALLESLNKNQRFHRFLSSKHMEDYPFEDEE